MAARRGFGGEAAARRRGGGGGVETREREIGLGRKGFPFSFLFFLFFLFLFLFFYFLLGEICEAVAAQIKSDNVGLEFHAAQFPFVLISPILLPPPCPRRLCLLSRTRDREFEISTRSQIWRTIIFIPLTGSSLVCSKNSSKQL